MPTASESLDHHDDKLLRKTRRLTRALTRDPDQVSVSQVVRVIRRLREAERLPKATRLTQLALRRFPGETALLEEARELLNPVDLDIAYRAGILESPHEEKLVAAWVAHLNATSPDTLLASLNDIQRAATVPIVGVLLRLLAAPTAASTRAEHARVIDDFLASDVASVCRRIWSDYTTLQPLSVADTEALALLPITDLRLFFAAQPATVLSLAEAAQTPYELNRGALEWYRDEFLTADVPTPDDRVFVTQRVRDIATTDDPRLSFQTRALRDGHLLVRDPHSGVDLVPFDSVIAFGRTVYSFGDQQLSLFISGGGGNKAVCLFLPQLNVLVDLGAELWHHITPARIANLQAHLLKRVASSRERYAEALAEASGPPSEQSIVAMMHSAENFAHHLWNYYPGLERIVDLGLQDRIAEIRTSGTQFFGPILDLFPEFSGIPYREEPRASVRDPYPFSRAHLVIAPGGYFIRTSLVRRVVAHMAALPSGGAPDPSSLTGLPFPVVWLGLRVGSRAWVDQEHEIPLLIDALHEQHPQALILLDGYSYPVGQDQISTKWAATIAQLHDVSRRIVSTVHRPDQVIDMVGNTLRESVLWAAVTDVYVAPSGTSQHKVGWLTDGPGVAYGPIGLTSRPVDERAGSYESEGRPVPLTLVGHTESAGARRRETDNRNNLDNIRLDRDELLGLLLDLIAQREGSTRAD